MTNRTKSDSKLAFSLTGKGGFVRLHAKYTIVENAGYEGENDLMAGFNSAAVAWNYAKMVYRKGEIERLHVQVRKDFADGTQTYEY